ncbi:MAG: hypothetical protein M1824_002216 [Vezdaea acicularis]|nr:MAG: hypothetical protein M1824_002216 [Vezdaea acicularis]
MVMEKGTEGNGFTVIDLPSRSYVHNLLSRPEWSAKEVMTNVGVFVWILGPGVVQDPAIQNFIKETEHVKHIITSPEVCPNFIAFTSSAAASTRLSKLDPSRYTIPIYDNRESMPLWRALSISTESQKGYGYQTPTPRMEVGLQPKIEVKTDFQPVNTAEVLAEMDKEVLKLGEDARQSLLGSEKLEELRKLQEDLPSQDAEIIAFGTGSAIPSNYRNVSGTLLRIPGRGSYLFDCGENTLGQMRRTFSEVQLREVLRDLRCIWISHLHADHHLGTISVIKAWHDEVHGEGESSKTQQVGGLDALRYDGRLFVISDKAMGQWLGEYSSVEDYGYEKIVPLHITNNTVYSGSKLSLVKAIPVAGPSMEQGIDHEAVFSAMRCSDIQAVAIDHCNGAKAVSFTWPDGFKFSYSGDGRPCKPFIRIGQHSTVLLHEATFDDELHNEALQKKHSTTSEALAVAKGMHARRVLLTHFSQRYPKFPVFDGIDTRLAQLEADLAREENAENDNDNNNIDPADSATHHHTTTSPPAALTRFTHDPASDMKVGVMFDYMRVRVGEIAHLEAFTPALRRLCESIEEGEAKVERKQVVEEDERLGKGKGGKKSKQGKAGSMASVPGEAGAAAAMAGGAE